MRVDAAIIDYLKRYYVSRRGDTTVGGTLKPNATDTHNLGSPSNRFDTIYARQVVADSVSGAGGGADMVDGFHAYATPTPNSLLALDSNGKYSSDVYPLALLLDGSRALHGDLPVDPNIKVDGVDISAHAADGSIHHLSGMAVDDHTQYVHNSIARTIAAVHLFSPTVTSPPFYLGAKAQGQTVPYLKADQLNKDVIAGNGLIGGGALDIDVTLNVGAGNGIQVSANDVAVKLATDSGLFVDVSGLALGSPSTLSALTSNGVTSSTHVHGITAYSDSTIAGQSGHLVKTDANGDIKLHKLALTDRLTASIIDSEPGTGLTISPGLDLILSPDSEWVRLDGVALATMDWASGSTGWGITPDGSGDFRYIKSNEIHTENFVTDYEQALAGGQIITKSVATLAADFDTSVVPRTLTVNNIGGSAQPVFVDSDVIVMKTFSWQNGGVMNISYIKGTVSNYVDNADGTQTWEFTLTSGSGTIQKGSSVALDFGSVANPYGIYEVSAVDGAWGVNSPYAQIATWSGDPITGKTVRSRMGNLAGISGQSGYGLYAMQDTSTYLSIGSAGAELHNLPLRLYSGTTKIIALEPNSGNPYLAVGNPVPTDYLSSTGIWMGRNSSQYKMHVGSVSGGVLTNGWSWDGSKLRVVGSQIVGPGVGYAAYGVKFHLTFSGPAPYEKDYQVNLNGNLGQVPGGYNSVIGRPGQFGKAAQVDESGWNICTNPSFETSTGNGWSYYVNTGTGASAAVTSSTDYAWIGSYSAKIAVANGGASANDVQFYFPWNTTAGQPYTVQFRIRADGSYSGVSVSVMKNGSPYTAYASASVSVSDGEWTTVYLTIPSAAATESVRLNFLLGGSARTFYIDGVQIEQKGYATSYADGSMGIGHSWGGTPHNSTSTRNNGYLWYTANDNVDISEGTVVIRFTPTAGSGTGTQRPWFNVGSSAYDVAGSIQAFMYTSNGLYVRLRDKSQYWSAFGGSAITYSSGDHLMLAVTWKNNGNFQAWLYKNGSFVIGSSAVGPIHLTGWSENILRVGYGYQGSPGGVLLDEFIILDHQLTRDDFDQIAVSGSQITVQHSKFEIMLTGYNSGKVWGNSGGLFGVAADGAAAFALLTTGLSSASWGGFSNPGTGDVILGDRSVGAAAMWDRSTGILGFYGTFQTDPQIYISAWGSLVSGKGAVILNTDGLQMQGDGDSYSYAGHEAYLSWVDASGNYFSGIGASKRLSSYKGSWDVIAPTGSLKAYIDLLAAYGVNTGARIHIEDTNSAASSITLTAASIVINGKPNVQNGGSDADWLVQGKRSIGYYPGWGSTTLFINGYGDWAGGVSVGSSSHPSSLAVIGDTNVTGSYKVDGYAGGIFVPLTSTVYLKDSSNFSWDGGSGTARGTGTYTFNLSSGTNNNGLPTGIKAIVIRLGGQWTAASYSNNAVAQPGNAGSSVLTVRAVAANFYTDAQGVVPVSSDQIRIVINGLQINNPIAVLVGYFM
jgi:hypothetical protein